MSDFSDLMALSDLLKPQDDDVSDPRENKITPYNIHGAAKLPKEAMDRPIGQIVQKDPKAIWDVDEIASDGEDDEEGDLRSRPKHEILYKQDVMTEDVFLGLGDKDPSVAHCDAMVVKIAFPSHSLNEIDLDVTAHKLVAQSHELYRAVVEILVFMHPLW
ncbi:unnamed protein product [Aphanomyces euteiches]